MLEQNALSPLVCAVDKFIIKTVDASSHLKKTCLVFVSKHSGMRLNISMPIRPGSNVALLMRRT
jgi:hypothetical protein